MAKRKNPWVAAILNFLIWGLGYHYVGSKRMWFRVTLIVAEVLGIIFSAYMLALGALQVGPAGPSDIALAILGLLISLAFAWDAYQDALGRK